MEKEKKKYGHTQRKFGTNIQCEFLSKHRKTPLLKLLFLHQPTNHGNAHSFIKTDVKQGIM